MRIKKDSLTEKKRFTVFHSRNPFFCPEKRKRSIQNDIFLPLAGIISPALQSRGSVFPPPPMVQEDPGPGYGSPPVGITSDKRRWRQDTETIVSAVPRKHSISRTHTNREILR